MRMFGTFHNHMHEMMTNLARYGAEELGDGDRIPEFDNRISGGEWGDDRVHHAMYRSVVYDRTSRARAADFDDYVGEGRAPHPSEVAVIRADQANTA